MDRSVRIGILAHQFLNTDGASDFLRNLLRGLEVGSPHRLFFMCPRMSETVQERVSKSIRQTLGRLPGVKRVARAALRIGGPVVEKAMPGVVVGIYSHFIEVAPSMTIVPCDDTVDALRAAMERHRLNLIMPSMRALPAELPHISYWPDCQPKYFPELFDEATRSFRDATISGMVSSGRPMIINSRHAKEDMVRFYGARPELVFELPFAPVIEADKLQPRPELVEPYRLAEPYFIVCNQFWAHKSLETVLEAVAHLRDNRIEARVVFTGKMSDPRKPGYVGSLHEIVRSMNLAEHITFVGFVHKDHQIELMRRAVAVLQPSLFEGGPGGGSVYEACAIGTRAIISDIPVNREIPLDETRLLFFEPRNARDLARQMGRVLATDYVAPEAETLARLSQAAAAKLGARLEQVIAAALRKRDS